MPNVNLITNPAINGNVSSCKTEISVVNCASRNNLFYCTDKGYATNNCTGQTDILISWSLTGFSMFLMGIFGLIIFFLCLKIIIDY